MKTRTRIIVILPLVLILGTIFYIFMDSTGLSIPWKMVGKPPEKLSEIIGFNWGVNRLYVNSVSGEMYSDQCDLSGVPYTDWKKDQSYKKELDPIFDSRYEQKKFLTPYAPFQVKQIYYLEDHQAMEGSFFLAFALSEDGNLWHWEHGSGVYQGLFQLVILGIEILAYGLGLILYMVINLIIRAFRNHASKKESDR